MINVRRRMAQRRPRGRSGHAAAIATLAIALGLANADARSASIVQPDLRIEKIGAVTQGVPAQMVFGPDHRLYVSLANLDASRPNAASVVSFGYDPAENLAGERVAAATGGAIGVAFGPVTLGNYGERGAITTTGMYLTDTARNGNANLRVLTSNAAGFYGGSAVRIRSSLRTFRRAFMKPISCWSSAIATAARLCSWDRRAHDRWRHGLSTSREPARPGVGRHDLLD